MTPVQFEAIYNDFIKEVHRTLIIKGGEYASDNDRLANFYEASRRQNLNPERVLFVYLDKHFAALQNYLKDMENHRSRPRSEAISGRIVDAVNYLILLHAMLIERKAMVDEVLGADEEENLRSLNWGDD